MKKILSFVLATTCLIGYSQINYVNQIWSQTSGSPSINDPQVKTALDPVGNLVYVGGHSNGLNSDIFLNCIHPDGSIAWGQICPSSSTEDDWGEDLVLDASGNIFICGVRHNGANNDFFVAKYSAGGTLLWDQSFDNGGDDRAVGIAIDGANDVYVTGTSEVISFLPSSDLSTIKLNGTDGTLIWNKLYDFNNLPEIGVDIGVNMNGEIIVCGASAQNMVDSRFTVIKYSAVNGDQLAVKRHNSPGNGYDLPSEMQLKNGLIYVVGTTDLNSQNTDIKVLSLDNQLNLNWVAYYDKYGENDFGKALAISDNNEVAVTGYSENIYGGTEFITALFSSNGATLWCQTKRGENEVSAAEGKAIQIDHNNNVLVTGFIETGGFFEYRTASLDLAGQLNWQKTYSSPQKNSRGTQILTQANDVIVTGDVSDISGKDLTSIRYSTSKRETNIGFHQGMPAYLKDQLIVKLDPSVLNILEVDDLDKEFWTLEEITSADFANKVRTRLVKSCSECPIIVYRIFKKIPSTIKSTTNRLGQQVPFPDFWSVFVFEFPSGTDVNLVSNDLMSLFPEINYSTLDLLGEEHAVPTDPLYDQQISLHTDISGTYTDSSNINVEHAWDYTVGRRDVKIGIFEPSIFQWYHEDFGGPLQAMNKFDGWVLNPGVSMFDTTTYDGLGHANSVSGIIGAIRNNDLGIAGIAGGDYENGEDLDSSGCALFGLTLGANDTLLLMDLVAEGIVISSIDSAVLDFGYGLHISNNSLALFPNQPIFLDTNVTLFRDAYHFANRQQVTVVASSGNNGLYQDTSSLFDPVYPASFDEDWILCVGGTGTDGQYIDNSDVVNETFAASRGYEIDVAAPACLSHIRTTQIVTLGGFSAYAPFVGTSGSAPHVSGLAGLLMSYLNDTVPNYQNLAPEDVEKIIESSATDTDLPGLDSLTGYGMINAGAALDYVNKETRVLRHFGTSSVPSTITSVLSSSNDTVTLSEIYTNDAGVWFQWNTPYVVNTWEVDFSCNHNIPTNESILAYWPRASSSTTFAQFGADNVVYPREKVDLLTMNFTGATLKGVVYEVFDTLGNPLGWWPFDLNGNLEAEYTVLTSGNFASISELENEDDISVFPNPSNGEQTISIFTNQPMDANIRLYNSEGMLIEIVFSGSLNKGKNVLENNISNLASGIYIYSIEFENEEIKHCKFVKN